jgi:hypothetical protein
MANKNKNKNYKSKVFIYPMIQETKMSLNTTSPSFFV